MRFLLLFLCFLTDVRSLIVTQCEADARDVASKKIKQCKSLATRKVLGRGNGAIKEFRKLLTQYEREKTMKKNENCAKAKQLYEPNGLMSSIPPTWGCEKDEAVQAVLEKLAKQDLNIDQSPEAFNIVLVGRTGAGKSYFANALLGVLTPGRKQGVYFPAKATDGSVTQNVFAQTGNLFGGLYDKELGLTKSLKINVFDTPGFADANIENVRKNKLLIASSLKNDIHMVIFLTSGPRLDADNQLALQMLNEWTAGKIWPNLLIVKGRTSFDTDDIAARFENDNSIFRMKSNEHIVNFLQKRNNRDAWTEKTIVDDKVQSRVLTKEDFQKIRISLMNMSQHRECISDPKTNKKPTQDCWKMPLFDGKEYQTDYDDSYNEYPITDNGTFAFIEEAKQFTSVLKEMKTHPVIPSAKIFEVELKKDATEYEALLAKEKEIDDKIAEESQQGDKLLAAYAKCEDAKIDTSMCPEWREWGEWTECGECGVQSIKRLRQGCMAEGNMVDMQVCEINFGTKRHEKEICEGLPECNNNAELLAEMERIRQEEAKKQQEMMMNMFKTMNDQQKASQENMVKMMQEMQENTMQMIASMPKPQPVVVRRGGGCFSTESYGFDCKSKTKKLLTEFKRGDSILHCIRSTFNETTDCTKVVGRDLAVSTDPIDMFQIGVGNTTVTMTANHIIYVKEDSKFIKKAAGDLKIGDIVNFQNSHVPIHSIETTQAEPINLITSNFDVVVNDIAATVLVTEIPPVLITIADEILTQDGMTNPDISNLIISELKEAVWPVIGIKKYRNQLLTSAIFGVVQEYALKLTNSAKIQTLINQIA